MTLKQIESKMQNMQVDEIIVCKHGLYRWAIGKIVNQQGFAFRVKDADRPLQPGIVFPSIPQAIEAIKVMEE